MRSTAIAALVAAVLIAGACTGKLSSPPPPTGPKDSGPPQGILITVSGSARVYPPAAAYLSTTSTQPPALAGLTLSLEDFYGAALNAASARFGQATLDATGAFSFSGVDTAYVTWLLAGDVRESADGGSASVNVAPAATALYDVGLNGAPPQGNLDGGWVDVLPVQFVSALAASVGQGNIQLIADAGVTLQQAGFIVGQIRDGTGAPVPAVSLVPADPALAAQIFYPSASYGGLSADSGTSASGMFVFVHTGGTPVSFPLTVEGHPEYGARNAAAAPGVGLVLDLVPQL